MNSFIRYYNQNRKKIWGIVIIIASAILVIQVINFFVKRGTEEEIANANNITQEPKIQTNSSTVTTNRSVVTGQSISQEKLQRETTLIDDFLTYCNNGDIENAYNMLTNECKEEMFENIDIFRDVYYNNNFNGQKKNCTVENWTESTYKVRMVEDLLSTGKSNEGSAIQDYITIVEQDDTYKLNINNFIGRKQINRITENDNIKAEVLYANQYSDYVEYRLKITNNTENTIFLDSREEIKSLYIEDSNGSTSSAYTQELTVPMLTVQVGHTNDISIKFYAGYVYDREIEQIVFSDIILDANAYQEFRNTLNYKNRLEFRVNV